VQENDEKAKSKEWKEIRVVRVGQRDVGDVPKVVKNGYQLSRSMVKKECKRLLKDPQELRRMAQEAFSKAKKEVLGYEDLGQEE